MGARDVHIAKYTTRYAALYPTAAILVAKFEAAQLWAGEAAGRRAVEAAVMYLKARAASCELDDDSSAGRSGGGGRPRVLIHLFSNGGATTMQNIYLAWHHHHHPSSSPSLSPKSTPFPASVAIYDSAPGLPTLLRTYRAFSISALPQGTHIRKTILRAVLTPLLAAVCVLSWVYMHVLLRRVLVPLGLAGEDVLSRNFTLLNDAGRMDINDGGSGSGSSSAGKTPGAGVRGEGATRGGLIGSQTLRTYIYSKQDAMIDWRHVEMHAADAATGGVNKNANNNNKNHNNGEVSSPTTSTRRTKIPCRLEMFHGSGHVAHMRHDPERYWRVVVETWEQGCR